MHFIRHCDGSYQLTTQAITSSSGFFSFGCSDDLPLLSKELPLTYLCTAFMSFRPDSPLLSSSKTRTLSSKTNTRRHLLQELVIPSVIWSLVPHMPQTAQRKRPEFFAAMLTDEISAADKSKKKQQKVTVMYRLDQNFNTRACSRI